MKRTQDKDMVQTFFPDWANPAFSKGIGIRCRVGGVNNMEPLGLKNNIKGLGEFSIIVMDQETKRKILLAKFPNQLSGLLSDPNLVGVGSDPGKVDASGTQFDKEQHIDRFEPNCLYSKEIAG